MASRVDDSALDNSEKYSSPGVSNAVSSESDLSNEMKQAQVFWLDNLSLMARSAFHRYGI